MVSVIFDNLAEGLSLEKKVEEYPPAATTSSASKILFKAFGVPLRGPSPSISTMPSAMTKCGRTVVQISRMLS